MLSALTLCLSFNSRSKTETHFIVNYFIRRFFRIAPLYYFILVICLTFKIYSIYWLGYNIHNLNVLNIITHFTFTNGIFPFYINSIIGGEWSIAIEMEFYLIFPLLFSFFNIKNHTTIIFYIIVYYFLLRLALHYLSPLNPINNIEMWSNYLFLWLPNQLIFFLMGFLLFKIHTKYERTYHTTKTKYKYLFLTLIFIVVIKFTSVYTIAIVSFLTVIIANYFKPCILVNKSMISIGKLSYSIYLIHALAYSIYLKYYITKTTDSIFTYLTIYVVFFLVSYMVSYVSYKLIEIPCQRLGKKIIATVSS